MGEEIFPTAVSQVGVYTHNFDLITKLEELNSENADFMVYRIPDKYTYRIYIR